MVKNLPASARDVGSIPGSGRSPGKGNGNPLQDSCLGNSMDRGALMGYTPWGNKESDTTTTFISRCIILYTGNLHNFINQYYLSKN